MNDSVGVRTKLSLSPLYDLVDIVSERRLRYRQDENMIPQIPVHDFACARRYQVISLAGECQGANLDLERESRRVASLSDGGGG